MEHYNQGLQITFKSTICSNLISTIWAETIFRVYAHSCFDQKRLFAAGQSTYTDKMMPAEMAELTTSRLSATAINSLKEEKWVLILW